MTGEQRPVTLTYRNHRGETAERTITPKRVWFGSTEWHPEPQWLLTAFDHDKQADRDFALKDFGGADLSWALPCDVRLPPVTTIRRGCNLSTLITGIRQRERFPEEARVFTDRRPAPGQDLAFMQVFWNDGHDLPDTRGTDCPYCGGSGHKDDVQLADGPATSTPVADSVSADPAVKPEPPAGLVALAEERFGWAPHSDTLVPAIAAFAAEYAAEQMRDWSARALIAEVRAEAAEKALARFQTDMQDFDMADWYWRTADPDDSGVTPEEAISNAVGKFVVCEIASSFTGPVRYGFSAPTLAEDDDETEFLHFETRDEAAAAAQERAAAIRARKGGDDDAGA